jgi:Carboxypeptidase regulatory-like domain
MRVWALLPGRRFRKSGPVCLCLTLLALAASAFPQNTISTGSVQGTVTDISGAAVAGAKITITSKATNHEVRVSTTGSGLYNSGTLLPGDYVVRAEKEGFQLFEFGTAVQVGVTTLGNVQLKPGAKGEVVTVRAPAVRVNTEQSTVQGVLTTEQIDTLPINGRNFLDLAQLEPGVQIQDGGSLDPTKTGFSSISFGGRFGRTARIELDGIDVSDEVSGTTTQDVPQSAIEEFQLSQSMLDLSTELTSSGSVNVVTRSGTNLVHGEAFYLFRDSSEAARLPGPPAPFQRNQFGGRLGGPVIRNKLFLFGDVERVKQDAFAPVPLADPFSALSGGFNAPFRETQTIGRLDYKLQNLSFFYRFIYFQNSAVSTGGASSFQPFANRDITPSNAVGIDFNTGKYSHSIRASYLKFRNNLSDAVTGSNIFNPLPSITLGVGPLNTGPAFVAPQATFQSNKQIKYDGWRTAGSHILRYGIMFNRIHAGGFAKLNSLAPNVFASLGTDEEIFADNSCGTGVSCFGGGRSNPLNYPMEFAQFGNGQGFVTEKTAFGLRGGGLGPDNRLAWYLGDVWKIRSNLTLTLGLRYVRDTGRTNSDLPPIAALNAVLPGLGNRVRQPNLNFAPQVGVAWDPKKDGKTVVRSGIGLFYENVVYGGFVPDRIGRLPKGAFLAFPLGCEFGFSVPVTFADGTSQTAPPGACYSGSPGNLTPIGTAAASLVAFQSEFQSVASAVGLNATNPDYLGNSIANGSPINVVTYAPNYQTPRSIQMNVGIQRELWPGAVVSADYLRNVALHFSISIDANHSGDTRYLNTPATQASISATNSKFGCGTGSDTASIDCAISNGAVLGNYASFGLDSPGDLTGGPPCTAGNILNATGNLVSTGCAFAGINPTVGSVPILFPSGRAVYNALQVVLRQDLERPVRPLKSFNMQVSYSFSRFVNPGVDQEVPFASTAVDNRNPLRFTGPSGLDRTHQLSFGGTADLPGSFRVSFISHFSSPLPLTLQVPLSGGELGEIFRTDFTGDGTVRDIMPVTHVGSFARDFGVGGLNQVIGHYNGNVANQLTPAGQALVAAGLFRSDQLMQLGAVAPTVAPAPSGQVSMGDLRTFDVKACWRYKFRKRRAIEPSVGIFNLFNFANFDLPSSTLDGVLRGTPGTVNGTTGADRISNRVGVGTGVFSLGAPRVIEFGLRLEF